MERNDQNKPKNKSNSTLPYIQKNERAMVITQDIIDKLTELPIEDVAKRLGLDIKKHKTKCFMHDDTNPSLSFSISKNLYKCWVCNKGGNTIQLVRDKECLGFKEACIWLAREFNIDIPEGYKPYEQIKKSQKRTVLPKITTTASYIDEEIFRWLIETAGLSHMAQRFLFEERLYDKEIVRRLNIKSISDSKKVTDALISRFGEERCLSTGLVKKGKYGLYFHFNAPCLLLPYYEQDGKLIGVQSRYLGEDKKITKYKFLSSQKTRLFNLPILNTLQKTDKIYISEGITDCIAMLSKGLNAVAIPSATNIPYEDLLLLKNHEIHMCPDNDEPGQRAFREIRQFYVNNYATIKKEQLSEGVKDYSEYYIAMANDNGK